VNDLVVDSHLEAIVVDDKDADTATAVVEGLGETADEATLVKDGKALLDITALGHGDDATILADIENTVLLEDRTKHVLDNDRGGWVGDEAGLLMKLLGEQVNTEVTVLTSLRGGGDADDLARAALKDQEIANADVVAGDGDGGRGSHLACGCWSRWGRLRGRGVRSVLDADDTLNWSTGLDGAGRRSGRNSSGVLFLYDDVLTTVFELGSLVGVLVRVVLVAVRVDGVSDTFSDLVSGFVETLTKRVVLTFVVVISHITLELLGGRRCGTSRFFYSNLCWVAGVNNTVVLMSGWPGVLLGRERLPCVTGGLLIVGVGAVVGITSFSDDGTSTFAELTLSNVDLGRSVVGGRAVNCIEVTVVGPVLYLDVGVGVGGGRLIAVLLGDVELDAFFALSWLSLSLSLSLTVKVCVRVNCLWLLKASLLVDVDFLVNLLGRLGLSWTTESVLLVDADFFLDVGVAVLRRGLRGKGSVDGGCEGFVNFFVTFPSV